MGVGAVLLIWLLFRSIPDDFWEPNETGMKRTAEFRSRTGHAGGGIPQGYGGGGSGARAGSGGGKAKDTDESRPPPRPKDKRPKEDMQYYDGEILFRKLPLTLNTIQRTMGFRKINQNVLYAASDPKSLAAIIPLACAMAKTEATYVHVTIFGRSSIGLEELMRINGVDEKECPAYWHDARPNWAAYSSDFRAEASVASALEHIHEFMHPQLVIMDDSSMEDQFFTRQVRVKAAKYEWPVIELPAGASEKLQWLSRMDVPALKAFHKTSIEILVQAPRGKAGGLLRLLRSLREADYTGLPVPKLTIELPSEVEPAVKEHIARFKWPPSASPFQPSLASQLNVRQRIPNQHLSPEEASIRFLESFYPAREDNTHVLVLSDNVELSPLFLHWIMYHVLHHKHSRTGSPFSDNLVGISLELPEKHLNGTAKFEAPTAQVLDPVVWPWKTDPRDPDVLPPFLWQAPNPNAALHFGDKWAEMHDFLTNRFRAAKERKTNAPKIIGKHLPAWTEYVLELMRAKGWTLLYPATGSSTKPMAVLHQDLQSIPEEFAQTRTDEGVDESSEPINGDPNEPLRGSEAHWKQPDPDVSRSHQPLHDVLPFQGEEPRLKSLPYLLYDGSIVENSDLGPAAMKYSEEFRRTVGGCADEKHEKHQVGPGKADELFCWDQKSPHS